MNKQIDDFSKNAITQFGLSKLSTKKYVGTFGAMSKSFGFAEQSAYEMSKTVTGLVGDVSSFYNISQDLAYTKLKSIWTGETETLKDLGIVMTQTALQEYALKNGIQTTVDKMTEAQKVSLRYKFVQEQLSTATGDFARTSGGWANQIRVLSLQFDQFRATLGQGFINVFTPIIKVINILISKLQIFANAFKKVTEMIFGKQSDTSNTTSGVKDLANGYDSVGESAGTAAKETQKASKKMQKAVMKYDALNILSNSRDNNKNPGSSGSFDSAITGFDNIDTSVSDIDSKLDSMIDNAIKKFTELTNLFSKGFNIGFGDYNFNNIIKHLDNIKNSLLEIVTDPKIISGFDKFINNIVFNLGKITGSISSIGISIGENLLGGLDIYLSNNSDTVKQHILTIFDISNDFRDIVANFILSVSDIFSIFRTPQAKQITADLIGIFVEASFGIYEVLGILGNDILRIITEPIINNAPKIKNTLRGLFEPIHKVLSTIETSIKNTFDTFNDIYNSNMKPAIDNIIKGLTNLIGFITSQWDKYIKPVFDAISQKFSEVWTSKIQPALDNFIGVIGVIIEYLSIVWKNYLEPMFEWIGSTIIPIVMPIIERIVNSVIETAGFIINAVGNILGVLKGILNFVVGIFSADWNKAFNGIKDVINNVFEIINNVISGFTGFVSNQFDFIKDFLGGLGSAFKEKIDFIGEKVNGIKKYFRNAYNDITGIFDNIPDWFKEKFTKAWTAVKNVFSTGGKIFDGIKDGIASTFKTIVNGIVKGINKVIKVPFDSINKMLNNIRNVGVAGVKPFKGLWGYNPLSVPQIPQFAQGTYLPPNSPQLAIVGDNKRYGEFVTPENKLDDAIDRGYKRNNSRYNNKVQLELTIIVKGEDGKTIIKKINNAQIEEGKILLEI